jgi:hypothetical protein
MVIQTVIKIEPANNSNHIGALFQSKNSLKNCRFF